jgi:hypothetical protein
MERNFKLYRAAAHLIEAAKYVRGIDNEIRDDILAKSEHLLSLIVIDDEEIRKVEEYGRIIRKELIAENVDRTDNHTGV